MSYMEQKIQEQYEAGESRMEYLCEIADKLNAFLNENKLPPDDVLESIEFARQEKIMWYLPEPEVSADNLNPGESDSPCPNCGRYVHCEDFCGCIPW